MVGYARKTPEWRARVEKRKPRNAEREELSEVQSERGVYYHGSQESGCFKGLLINRYEYTQEVWYVKSKNHL